MARLPCPSCPWRVDQDATAIPNFRLELAEGLDRTSPDERGFGPDFTADGEPPPMFACHQSTDLTKVVCTGWLAAVGSAHPVVRLAVMKGEYDPEDLRPGAGWPELHRNFQEVIDKLRRTTKWRR
jgi:Family of unknown function (DUF6283)